MKDVEPLKRYIVKSLQRYSDENILADLAIYDPSLRHFTTQRFSDVTI